MESENEGDNSIYRKVCLRSTDHSHGMLQQERILGEIPSLFQMHVELALKSVLR